MNIPNQLSRNKLAGLGTITVGLTVGLTVQSVWI